MRNSYYTLSLRLLFFAFAVLILGYCVYEKQWIWLGAGIIVLFISARGLYRHYKRNNQKVAFMFDAIDNNDFSFQFSPSGGIQDDEIVNDALNRVIKILHQAKADAVQKEKYYEMILSSVSTGIVVFEDSGYVFQTNSEALRLLGLNVFTHIKQLGFVDEHLREVVENMRAGEKEQISFVNERGTVNLSIRVSDMLLREKHVRILAINDINSELDQMEIDSWIRLTRVLTHEIMNSVTPIASMSETMLSLDQEIDGTVRDGLEVINTTCNGLLSFVDSYRRFTHIPTPKPTLFYVKKLAERTIHLSRHQQEYSNITINVHIEPDELILYADENLITHVILNLLRNAMQAIGEDNPDGTIEFKAYCNDKESVIIEISNNGPAISSEIVQHMFVPFFTTKEGGSGIGLSISRQIMRLSGGSLSPKNSPDTRPTTFMLIFP